MSTSSYGKIKAPIFGEDQIEHWPSVWDGDNYCDIGLVFRNHDGVILRACVKCVMGTFSLEVAKYMEFRDGLSWLLIWRIPLAMLECDAWMVV